MLKLFSGIDRFFGISFFYGVFFFTISWWLFQKVRFREIEEWPGVEAEILEHESRSVRYRWETMTGTRMGATDASHVTFEYVVDGVVYQSSLATPDGGGIPPGPNAEGSEDKPWNESWVAHYKPGSPGLAVLSPVPYKGFLWLAIATTCGIPVGVHFYFWIVEAIARSRRVKVGEQS